MPAKVMQVIYTDLQHRGMGRDKEDVFRLVTQLWTLDGKLIVEIDPQTNEVVVGDGLVQLYQDAGDD